jgi:NMT1/THI5 like
VPRTIRLQGDSNAHDRPWRVAVERGYFTDEGLDVEYHEDNPKGVAGRVENFSHPRRNSPTGRTKPIEQSRGRLAVRD